MQREYRKLTGNKYYSDTKEFKDAVTPKLTNTIAKYIKDVRKGITIENWINEWANDLSSYLYRPHQLLLKVAEFPHFIQLHILNFITDYNGKFYFEFTVIITNDKNENTTKYIGVSVDPINDACAIQNPQHQNLNYV